MNKVLTLAIAFTIMNCGHLNHDFKESKRETEKSKRASKINLRGSEPSVAVTPSSSTTEKVEIQEEKVEIHEEKVEIHESRKKLMSLFSNIDKWNRQVRELEDLFSSIDFRNGHNRYMSQTLEKIKEDRDEYQAGEYLELCKLYTHTFEDYKWELRDWDEVFYPWISQDIMQNLYKFFEKKMQSLFEYLKNTKPNHNIAVVEEVDYFDERIVDWSVIKKVDKVVKENVDSFFNNFGKSKEIIWVGFENMKKSLLDDLKKFKEEFPSELERCAFPEMTQKDFNKLTISIKEDYKKLSNQECKLSDYFKKWKTCLSELFTEIEKLYNDEFMICRKRLLKQEHEHEQERKKFWELYGEKSDGNI